jgi:hypothetical protein
MKNMKDSVIMKKGKSKKAARKKRSNILDDILISYLEIIASIGYLFITLTLGSIFFFNTLIYKPLPLQLFLLVTFFSALVSFFIVAYSDPGYIVEEFKTTLDEKTMRSLEEVY